MRFPLHIFVPFAALAALISCGGDGGPTGPAQRLTAVGRLERGSTVRLVAADGAAADTLVSNVVVSPAAAGTVVGASVKLLQAGQVTVTGAAPDGRSISAV